jgi:GntR family transcriptional regulator
LASQSLNNGFRVDERLPTPLYHQIYLILRSKILDGTYGRDDRLPGEQEIVRQFGVSRITAKRALDELAAAGLAVRERGRGTKVRYIRPAQPLTSSVEGLLENLLVMGLETKVKLLEFAYVQAFDDVAEALECASGAGMRLWRDRATLGPGALAEGRAAVLSDHLRARGGRPFL